MRRFTRMVFALLMAAGIAWGSAGAKEAPREPSAETLIEAARGAGAGEAG